MRIFALARIVLPVLLGLAGSAHAATMASVSGFGDLTIQASGVVYLDFGQLSLTNLVLSADSSIEIGGSAFPVSAPTVFDSTEVHAGVAPRPEGEQTTHYCVLDADGFAVSITTTLNFGYGSLITVPVAGFLLNNEMDDFSAKPGVPNAYGLVGAEANAVRPNKRMLSSMSPTVVTKDGRVVLVVRGRAARACGCTW